VIFITNRMSGRGRRVLAQTNVYARQEVWCWFFRAIDHCSEDIVGWHVAKRGDRWAALEPIRQGVRRTHGRYAPKIALGLGLRTGDRTLIIRLCS